jgi:hypothetical protein
MHVSRSFALLSLAAGLFCAISPKSSAQISINIGAPPSCPYGYYDTAPYSCAPYGYYGPEWFNGGVFIGAGKWFHGPANFHGSVNNNFHPDHGYKGALPKPGEHPVAGRPASPSNFKGNEVRDGRGHTVKR